MQFVDRQQHQIMQTQTGHGFELRACPVHTLRHETLSAGASPRLALALTADAPQQAFGFSNVRQPQVPQGV